MWYVVWVLTLIFGSFFIAKNAARMERQGSGPSKGKKPQVRSIKSKSACSIEKKPSK